MTKAYNLSIEKFDPCKVVMHFSESLIKVSSFLQSIFT